MTVKSEYDDDAYVARVHDEEENNCEKDPMAAPLMRRLQSRHLQMIAIGGVLLTSKVRQRIATDFLQRYHRSWAAGWVRNGLE